MNTTMTSRQNTNLKSVAWVVYGLIFIALVIALLFQTAFSTTPALFTLNQVDSLHIQAGHWYEVALGVVLACSILAIVLKKGFTVYLVSSIYTVAIIFTAIVGPTYLLHTDYGQYSLKFFTPIPWFLIWLSIIAMWLLVSSRAQATPVLQKSSRSNSVIKSKK